MSTTYRKLLTQDKPDQRHTATGIEVEHLPCVIFRLCGTNTSWPPLFSYISTQAREILGLEASAIVLDSSVFLAGIPDEDVAGLQAHVTRAFATSGRWDCEFRLQVAGMLRWFECCGRVHRLGTEGLWASGYLTDITQRKLTEIRAREIEARFMRAFEVAPQPIAILGVTGNVLGVNDAFSRILGYSPEEVPTLDSYMRLAVPDEGYRTRLLTEWAAGREQSLHSGQPSKPVVGRHRCKDGTELTVEAHTTWLSSECIVILTDITERVIAEERMRLWTSVLERSMEAIMICDPTSRILDVNPTFERVTGFSRQDVIGETPRILRSGRQDGKFYEKMWGEIKTTGMWSGEIYNRRKNGELYIEWMALNAVYDAAGCITHYVAIFSEITERKAAEERLRYLAEYDALTELPNRSLLLHRLEHSVESAARSELRIAVLFLDLDRFKIINDSMGHEAGDRLLRTVAHRITAVVRSSDTVARMGGDEFVILMSGFHGAADVARLAEELLAVVATPLMLEDQEVSVSASIGIGLFPGDGMQASDLLRNADTAMYRAKSGGRNRYEFYAPEMNEHAVERLQTENALRLALERQEFVLHYQPQVDLASGAIIGVEALIRWNRPGVGLVPPADFIPLAEECGLILKIGHWVVRESLRQIAAWDAMGLPTITVAVNVSLREFHERGFVDSLVQAINDSAVDPVRLELELTESAVAQDVEATTATLNRLHALGVKLSLDDFGTGYSSLNYLRRFPIQKIKIDRTFVSEITGKERSLRIVRAIIALAGGFAMKAIAEGVDSDEQMTALRAEQCDEVQGFLVSPALEAAQFEILWRGWKAAASAVRTIPCQSTIRARGEGAGGAPAGGDLDAVEEGRDHYGAGAAAGEGGSAHRQDAGKRCDQTSTQAQKANSRSRQFRT
jgi:diguanylate cyclase (GGDEF)-like protein/PAS domain S-box-containing protein